MVSRRNGELKRAVLSALAAMVAALIPSLVALPAQAESPAGREASREASREEQGKAGKPDKRDGKRAKKPHAAKGQKPHGKQGTKAEKQETTRKREEAQASAKASPKQGSAATPKDKKAKKTASRSVSTRGKKMAKKAESEAPTRPCLGPSVTVDRGGLEGETFPLVDCHGAPLDSARAELSLLARPWSVPRPRHHVKEAAPPYASRRARRAASTSSVGRGSASASPSDVAPGVRLIDPGLLTRLDAISRKFPNKPISLVSGYRPQSRGSQHQSGRALDLRVAGASNEELAAFCKTLADTGCGYYPNSSFIHVDVRNPGTGSVSWIDASGPGEAPRYVKQWPPPPSEEPDPRPSASEGAEPHDGAADPWRIDLDAGDDDKAPDSADDAGDTPASPAKSPPSETPRAAAPPLAKPGA
jgi:hypothetical protein